MIILICNTYMYIRAYNVICFWLRKMKWREIVFIPMPARKKQKAKKLLCQNKIKRFDREKKVVLKQQRLITCGPFNFNRKVYSF